MKVQDQIKAFIGSQPETKRSDIEFLHQRMLQLFPKIKLWFDEGKNSEGKLVTNPTIGYGQFTIQYANGTQKEFFQIGISANTTGISVYIMGLKDKSYLPATYSKTMGKATVTGYCIKFKALKDIQLKELESAILYGVTHTK